jgi:Maltose-binding periplasmic proteins/domains
MTKTATFKRWTSFALATMLIAVSAACGADQGGKAGGNSGSIGNTGANDGTNANTGEPAGKPDHLLVWANDDANHLKAVQQMAEAYGQAHGIRVEVVPVSAAEQVQKLALAAPSGQGPDLFFQPQDRLGDIVLQGLAEPVDTDDSVMAGYSEAALSAVRYDGRMYGYPVSIETYALYYNKELVPNPPATIEEAASMAAGLTDPSQDRYGYLMMPDFYYTIPFIVNYGGYVFGGEAGHYDAGDIGLNNEGAVAGLQSFQKFAKDVAIPETVTIDIINTLFAEGKAGMAVNGLWSLKTYQEQLGDKLGTAPLPAVNGKSSPSFVGVKSWFISSYSEYPEAAMDLAVYLTNDDNARLYHETTGEIPARTAVQDAIKDESYQGFVKQIESGIPMPNIPEMTPIWEMNNALGFILKGEDVSSVLNETVDIINQQIAAFGKAN